MCIFSFLFHLFLKISDLEKFRSVSNISTSSHDSINQEMHHFKPIKSVPRTPPKRLSGKLIIYMSIEKSFVRWDNHLLEKDQTFFFFLTWWISEPWPWTFIHIRINLPLFSTVVPSSIFMFLSCRPFVVITTLSTGLVCVEVTSVSWLGQLTVGV